MSVEVLSLVALVGSVLVLAWQSKEVATATRLASRATVEGAISDVAVHLGGVLQTMVTYPHLRQYVYDGVPLPASGEERARAETLCELLCDAAETTLEVTARLPHADDALIGWTLYARSILDSSPTCAAIVSANPSWYPRLSSV